MLRRPLLPVAGGILIGTVMTFSLSGAIAIDTVRSGGATNAALKVGAVLLYGTFMLGVCLLACVVPARRAMAIQPTDALRTD